MRSEGVDETNPVSGIDDSSPSGDVSDLFTTLSQELRSLAGAVFAEQRNDHTLQPTALINEVWLKLSKFSDRIQDRAHFLALAARAMRQVLTDYSRAKHTEKRGGRAYRLTFSAQSFGTDMPTFDLVDFNDSLDRLRELNERHAKVAELRLLGTLSMAEIATVLGVHERSVKRDWRIARLWLLAELHGT